VTTGNELMPGVIVDIQSLGTKIKFHPHLHFLVTQGGAGKVKKASLAAFPRIVEDELRPIPSRGWAEMIRKVYEVDPMVCPRRGGQEGAG